MELDNSFMSHQGNLVLPRVSRILLFSPLRNLLVHPFIGNLPTLLAEIPADSFYSDILEEVFINLQKKKS